MDIGSTTEIAEKQGSTFISHVFNFDEGTKDTLLNLSQYTALATVPIVLLNKAVQRLFPEPDESKTNLEVLAEIIGQLIFMIVSIFFVHRIITFIPTYSGVAYSEINLFNGILLFLTLILSVQTRVGQKFSILMDRLIDYYEGTPKKEKETKSSLNVEQQQMPIQQITMPPPPPPSIMTAPPPPPTLSSQEIPQQQMPQPQANIQFDDMYERQIEAFGGSTNGGLGYSFL